MKTFHFDPEHPRHENEPIMAVPAAHWVRLRNLCAAQSEALGAILNYMDGPTGSASERGALLRFRDALVEVTRIQIAELTNRKEPMQRIQIRRGTVPGTVEIIAGPFIRFAADRMLLLKLMEEASREIIEEADFDFDPQAIRARVGKTRT